MSDEPRDDTPTRPRVRLQRSWRSWVVPVLLAVLAVGLLWEWTESRNEVSALREELARRLRDSDTESRDARLLARQSQEAVRETQTRLTQVETRLAESQSQQVALEA